MSGWAWLKQLEPVVLLLFAGLIFFTGVLIFVEWKFNSDAQIFQVISSIVTGLLGAFLMRIKDVRDSHAAASPSNPITDQPTLSPVATSQGGQKP